MTDRYFVESPIAGERVSLGGAEAHHLLHVMRVKPGAEVVLFDGSGDEFAARVETVGRAHVELSVLERASVDRESRLHVSLGVTLPKGDRQRWLVEKLTELGVARLVPLVSEHSGGASAPAALDRLRRTVIEASKQCGRNRLMEIAPAQRFEEFLALSQGDELRLVAHPGGEPLPRLLARPTGTGTPGRAWLTVGPEGGFSASEIERAIAAGWQTVGLGPRILRIETAALALVAGMNLFADISHEK